MQNRWAAGVVVFFFALACGSEDSPPGNDGGSAGTTSSGSGGSGGTPGAGSGGTANNSGGSTGACQTYCTCHETNCSSTPIPGGMSCMDFCATFTADQLGCRQNMCGLVPAQPGNDHCTHSVGIDQCQ